LIRNLLPALAWAVFILIITGLPGKFVPRVTSFWEWVSYDKIVHIGIFAILSFLIMQGLIKQYLESKRRYLFVTAAVGFSLVYGLLTEVLQANVFIGRDGNLYDFLADSAGAFCGWLIFSYVNKKKIKTYTKTNPD
jgi:VanZ family protein